MLGGVEVEGRTFFQYGAKTKGPYALQNYIRSNFYFTQVCLESEVEKIQNLAEFTG